MKSNILLDTVRCPYVVATLIRRGPLACKPTRSEGVVQLHSIVNGYSRVALDLLVQEQYQLLMKSDPQRTSKCQRIAALYWHSAQRGLWQIELNPNACCPPHHPPTTHFLNYFCLSRSVSMVMCPCFITVSHQ
jgi:hypothetical protein